jgi:hypothetical protein
MHVERDISESASIKMRVQSSFVLVVTRSVNGDSKMERFGFQEAGK